MDRMVVMQINAFRLVPPWTGSGHAAPSYGLNALFMGTMIDSTRAQRPVEMIMTAMRDTTFCGWTKQVLETIAAAVGSAGHAHGEDPLGRLHTAASWNGCPQAVRLGDPSSPVRYRWIAWVGPAAGGCSALRLV